MAAQNNKEEKIFENVKKFDLYLITLLLLGIAVFVMVLFFKLPAAGGTSAYYTDIAENLLKGNGFSLDFIDEYYIKLPAVSHPEEWGFPMMAILTAPFIYLFGKTALAINLPNMLISIILFPVLVYYFGIEFFNKKVGFLAAVSYLFFAPIFDLSFTGQRDVIFAFFLLLGVLYFYKAVKDDSLKYFYLMGLFLGISYLVRQTTLIVFPTLILAYYTIKRRFDLKLVKGMLVSILVIAPWLIRNYLIFGDPLFTANKYALWVYGWFDYDPPGYGVYWNSQKPSLSWLLSLKILGAEKYSYILTKLETQVVLQYKTMLILAVSAFIGLLLTLKEKIKKSLLITSVSVAILSISIFAIIALSEPNFFLVNLFIFMYLIILMMANFIFAKESPANRIFAMLWAVFAFFHALFGYSDLRFFIPIIPFFLIYAWGGANRVLEKISGVYQNFNPKHHEKILISLLMIIVLVNISLIYTNLSKDIQDEKKTNQQKELGRIGELAKLATEKDAIIMGCNAITLHSLAERKTIEMPRDELRYVVEVIKWYKVNYITFSSCNKNFIDPNLFYLLFNQTELPNGYDKELYKIKLEEVQKGARSVILLNPTKVSG